MSKVGDFLRKIVTPKTAAAGATAATGGTLGIVTGIIGVGAALLGKKKENSQPSPQPFSGTQVQPPSKTPAWLWPVLIGVGVLVLIIGGFAVVVSLIKKK